MTTAKGEHRARVHEHAAFFSIASLNAFGERPGTRGRLREFPVLFAFSLFITGNSAAPAAQSLSRDR